MTPLLRAAWLGRAYDFERLFIKAEGLNLTGTFKARGMAAAVSRARELGIRSFAAPSAGPSGCGSADKHGRTHLPGESESGCLRAGRCRRKRENGSRKPQKNCRPNSTIISPITAPVDRPHYGAVCRLALSTVSACLAVCKPPSRPGVPMQTPTQSLGRRYDPPGGEQYVYWILENAAPKAGGGFRCGWFLDSIDDTACGY
jgi:Pyridoxal-phosphate dependent enzyme